MTLGRFNPADHREAIGGPGVDTRVWCAIARIDDDEDAIRWDEGIGWIADVTFITGPLANDGPNACRVADPFNENGGIDTAPPVAGCLCVVALPDGDPNTEPTIIGYLSAEDCAAPTELFGEELTEERAAGLHLRISSKGTAWQLGGEIDLRSSADVRVQSDGTARLLGEQVELAEEGASQAYVRGDDYAGAEGSFLDALLIWQEAVEAALNAAGSAIPPLISEAFTQSVSLFKERLVRGDLLSNRIEGE